MMDAQTKEVLFVTPAYETVTGYSRAALFPTAFFIATSFTRKIANASSASSTTP